MDRQDLSGARAWLQRAKEVGWGGAVWSCGVPQTIHWGFIHVLSLFKDSVMGWFMAIGCDVYGLPYVLHFLSIFCILIHQPGFTIRQGST